MLADDASSSTAEHAVPVAGDPSIAGDAFSRVASTEAAFSALLWHHMTPIIASGGE
jgi:hypothetical protein